MELCAASLTPLLTALQARNFFLGGMLEKLSGGREG
jgi:hypothetical protein